MLSILLNSSSITNSIEEVVFSVVKGAVVKGVVASIVVVSIYSSFYHIVGVSVCVGLEGANSAER